MAGKLKITQIRSFSGRKYDQRQTLEALGIRRIGHTVEQPDNPAIRGMIRKIVHLLKVTEG
ncbi:MAG: 50S ribosomal protein L30 [Candidatus Eisenbacteria bacterium]|nr:50S ribosomal protein L30 [Candidatus Eisenbacteria bacterium]